MNLATFPTVAKARHRLVVRGIVQGVGFRPFVHRLARELQLAGWVRNDSAGVTLEIEGAPTAVETMALRIARDAPPRARVDAVTLVERLAPVGHQGFAIIDSASTRSRTMIGPDTAICDECLAEMLDPANRRYRYAFINCTHCGPRYTITRGLPYDRAMTSMRRFAQCRRCLTEYLDPEHRRFHAEPNACRGCGPTLAFLDAAGEPHAEADPVTQALLRITDGGIVAVKGLGGFHLVCDARNAAAVQALRARKQREEKPFALMLANAASIAPYAEPDAAEAGVLASPERPIVLLRKRAGADQALAGVAPGLAWLGVMLPYTALHWLLFHEHAGRPSGTSWLHEPQPLALVMTSANPGGEPLVTGNAEAIERLRGIADAYLVHDREIVVRCDDSVVRMLPQSGSATPQFIRRARGYTPRSVALSSEGPVVLATGGWFKSAACVLREREAFLSQHVGDLDNAPTCHALEQTIEHLAAVLDVRPAVVAHDLHPDFFSTRLAARLATRWGAQLVGVQHHHAHVAAVLAEHRRDAPTLGLALDGVGLGDDGSAWGGELLLVDGARSQRLGRLQPLRLPGADRAAREPWRMAAAALWRAGRGDEIATRFADEPAARMVATMLVRNVNAPETSSAGRWFDAAAGLLGVVRRSAFEGQAAMLLEGLAAAHGEVAADDAAYVLTADGALDLTPLVARLAEGDDPGFGAALFHATLVAALTEWLARASRATGTATVALGGGCFLNAILAAGLRRDLHARGLQVLEAQLAPPNDGGLALGQAWVARRVLAAE
jgi:hydrogenase maturation protein HypF